MNSTIERGPAAAPSRQERPVDQSFLKDVVRQQWREKLEAVDKSKSKAIAANIDSHISKMNELVDPLDYEIFCIPNIVLNSKDMSEAEFGHYLGFIEAIAAGYSSMLGREIAGLALIGMTSKARSIRAVQRYHKKLSDDVEYKVLSYASMIERRNRKLERLCAIANSHHGSIFRFFRRARIARINRRIEKGRKKVESLSRKADRFRVIKGSMKVVPPPGGAPRDAGCT